MGASGKQITTLDILNGTILDADIASAASIAVAKLAHVGAGNVLRSNGTANVGGPLVAADIPAGAISQCATLTGIPTGTVTQSTAGVWYTLTGALLPMTGLTAGTTLLYFLSVSQRHSAANGRNSLRIVRDDTGMPVSQQTPPIGHALATGDFEHVGLGYFACPVTGSLTFRVEGYMSDAGTATTFPAAGYLQIVELKK